jgi:hypothetical protein
MARTTMIMSCCIKMSVLIVASCEVFLELFLNRPTYRAEGVPKDSWESATFAWQGLLEQTSADVRHLHEAQRSASR